jgi:hypothetical protein
MGMTFAVHVLLSDYGVSNARGNDHWHLLVIEGFVLVGAVLFWASFALRPAVADRSRAQNRHERR